MKTVDYILVMIANLAEVEDELKRLNVDTKSLRVAITMLKLAYDEIEEQGEENEHNTLLS